MSSFLTDAQLYAWGWRLPFLFSIVLVVVGLWIRFTIAESPEFQKIKDQKQEVKMPIVDAIRMYPKNILLAMGARFAENGFFYIYATFVLAYATQSLGMNRQDILNGVLIAAAIESFTIPAFGALSDRLGRRPVYIFGAVFSALMSFPLFMLLGTKNPQLGWIAIVLGLAVGHAAMYGPQASFLSELFGTKVRYSGVSLGYNLASIFAGALSPLIATGLMTAYRPETWPISVYMIALALITVGLGLFRNGNARERRGLIMGPPIIAAPQWGADEVGDGRLRSDPAGDDRKEGREAAEVRTNRNSRESGVRFETVSGGMQ